MVPRIIMLVAAVIACAYGVFGVKKMPEDKYFKVVTCGVAAGLLARVYYLLLVVSGGADTVTTIGTLGQASAYLFFTTANLKFLPDGKIDLKPGVLNVVGTVLACALFILSAVKYGLIPGYIGEGILTLTMGSALYISLSALKAKDFTFGFNVCVSVLVFLNAITEYLIVIDKEGLVLPVSILGGISVLLMLPLLKKGASIWEA